MSGCKRENLRLITIEGKQQSMKAVTSFSLNLAALLIALASATIAAAGAGNDTCVGFNATNGGTCTPLTNITSANNNNTALGADALEANTMGGDNTAIGATALQDNTAGFGNTATGEASLQHNTTGGSNTASGAFALQVNTSGASNTAAGDGALNSNTTGSGNTAAGASALQNNTTGDYNTATGLTGLVNNTTGQKNTATGTAALQDNTTGSFNIGIGLGAGLNLTTGDNNIDIFDAGVAGESNTIRIGTQGTQTATFIAGIFGSPKIKKGCDVIAQSNGLLGCMKSSARYKRDIRDMGDASDKLMKLRPVIFQYKEDTEGIQQYGLIAEEVEQVYPELVIDDADGRAETVAYQVLPAMLLNEVQKQSRKLAQKDAQIAAMRRQLVALQKKNSEIDALAERLDALERQARASRPDRLTAALR
jgi:hypothetical protein